MECSYSWWRLGCGVVTNFIHSIMKYYLETNALLKISKIPGYLISQSYTSYLSLFELVSGVKNETEYKIRKSCLKKIFESRLLILNESVKSRIWKMYGVEGVEDVNITPTFRLAMALVQSMDMEEFSNVVLTHNGLEYDLESYIASDIGLSREAVQNSRNASVRLSKDEQKAIPALDEITLDFLDHEARKQIISFGVKYSNPDRYFWSLKAIDHYQSGYMSIFMRAICFVTIQSLKKSLLGQNDIFDVGHLAFVEKGNIFVSNDKIYNRVSTSIGLNLLSFEDFIATRSQSSAVSDVGLRNA